MSPKAEAEQTAGSTAETPHPEAPVTAKAEAPPGPTDRNPPAAPSSAPEKAPCQCTAAATRHTGGRAARQAQPR
ncbi:hypothetical protein HTY54_27240 [Escherichia coli]|nr:hypothetical protein [Escherichia coli]